MIILALLLAFSIQGSLQAHAQAHAEHMAATGSFYHSDLTPLSTSSGGPCRWAGENLYRGHSDPSVRWAMYADSAGHAAILAHPRTHHAVGHAVSPEGAHYVVDVFCLVPAPPAPTTTMPALRAPPPAVAPSPPLRNPPPICPDDSTISREVCVA